jgi:hypothetical protein
MSEALLMSTAARCPYGIAGSREAGAGRSLRAPNTLPGNLKKFVFTVRKLDDPLPGLSWLSAGFYGIVLGIRTR